MKRILVIDDEEMMLTFLRDLLEAEGYEIITAANGAEGLALFEKHPVDLVITDMTMPGLTGNKLTRELLQIRPGLPVILCTGFSTELTEEKASQLGIKAFLMKPFVFRDLARIIRRVLDNRRV